jgi:hypothetical protein
MTISMPKHDTEEQQRSCNAGLHAGHPSSPFPLTLQSTRDSTLRHQKLDASARQIPTCISKQRFHLGVKELFVPAHSTPMIPYVVESSSAQNPAAARSYLRYALNLRLLVRMCRYPFTPI